MFILASLQKVGVEQIYFPVSIIMTFFFIIIINIIIIKQFGH